MAAEKAVGSLDSLIERRLHISRAADTFDADEGVATSVMVCDLDALGKVLAPSRDYVNAPYALFVDALVIDLRPSLTGWEGYMTGIELARCRNPYAESNHNQSALPAGKLDTLAERSTMLWRTVCVGSDPDAALTVP